MGQERPVRGRGFGPFSVPILVGSGKGRNGFLCVFGVAGGVVDLVKGLIALLLAAWSMAAFAIDEVNPDMQLVYTCKNSGNSSWISKGASAEAACGAFGSELEGRRIYQGSYNEVRTYDGITCNTQAQICTLRGSYTCTYVGSGTSCGSSQDTRQHSYTSAMEVFCGENAVPTGSGPSLTCACPKGYMPKADKKSCYQYTCPPSGSYTAVTSPDQKVPNAGDTICSGGCGFTPSSWKVGQDGQIWATWPFKSTGSFCPGAPNPDKPAVDTGEKNSKNPAPVACGANQCPGTVNGMAVCVPCRGTADAGSTTAASAPAGGSTGGEGSGSGDTTTTKQTECNGVSCTTTTTTKDSAGTVTGQVKEEKPQESFCQENPASPLCKKSAFGGACAATTCEGDAVQCAIAADQYRRNCQWFDDPAAAALAEAGQANMNGQAQPDGHPGKNATDTPISFANSIDQSDALGGASCPADVAFTVDVPLVGARSLEVALSKVCAPLQLVGQLGVAITLLWAAVFVFRGGA